jgi:hypothetical protein
MKTIKIYSLIILAMVFSSHTKSPVAFIKNTENTIVYYFHNTRRCPTCNAIEKVTKNTLENLFSNELQNGTIVFETYNAEEKMNKSLCQELGVTGSALIVLKGDKMTDLTSKGFMYALKQPKKLEEALIRALKE